MHLFIWRMFVLLILSVYWQSVNKSVFVRLFIDAIGEIRLDGSGARKEGKKKKV